MTDDYSISPSNTVQIKQGPVEKSILEYILQFHGAHVKNRAGAISLLLHSELISRGARLLDVNGNSKAVLERSCFDHDPIRLTYTLISRPKSGALSTPCFQLQLSVVETDKDIFVSLTDTTTDKFGHLELSGVEHVRLDSLVHANEPELIFPQLSELLDSIEEKLWKPVLPSPPLDKSERHKNLNEVPQPPRNISDNSENKSQIPFAFPDYGRSDLYPGGIERFSDPFNRGGSNRGGMLLDPRNLIRPGNSGSGNFMGGPDVLPAGAVPPGSRFDPFGPGFMRGGRSRHPGPDHALPPGFDDMYM